MTKSNCENKFLINLEKITLGGVLTLFPITYLSIKHGVNLSLYLLAIFSLTYWLLFSSNKWGAFQNKLDILIILSLASLFLATLITQFIRSDLYLSSLDGPSRLLFAGFVFIYLKNKSISYVLILKRAVPMGAMTLLCFLILNPETSAAWGGRYASKFVDPNSLGSQTLILGMICLFFIQAKNSKFDNFLLLSGFISSTYISLFTGSRGGWIAAPFILSLWIYLKINSSNLCANKKLIAIVGGLSLIILSIYLIYKNIPIINLRATLAQQEILAALTNENFNTSVGTRIGIWQICLKTLIPLAGFAGFGEGALAPIVTNLNLDPNKFAGPIFHLSNTGPHSDLLAKLLTMGYVGGFAYLLTILIPSLIFWKNCFHSNKDKQIAAQVGLCFTSGIFLCGLANEMLSLKYLCSFYGLMIATLLAEISKAPTNRRSHE